jgi:hypothetical protein
VTEYQPYYMSDMIAGLAQALFEALFGATGRRLLILFGWRRPDSLPSFFTGMAFWTIIGMLVYAVLMGSRPS